MFPRTIGGLHESMYLRGRIPRRARCFPPPRLRRLARPNSTLAKARLRKQWFCGGTVVVDTVVDKSYTVHFDVTCAKSPVLDAVGTMKISGKGAGTRP